jgi:hypothetical protein
MKMQAKNAMDTLRKKAYSSTWKKMPPAKESGEKTRERRPGGVEQEGLKRGAKSQIVDATTSSSINTHAPLPHSLPE